MYILKYLRLLCSYGQIQWTFLPYMELKCQQSGKGTNGEVIMTVKMPHDTVDTEVYIKTPRGHSGIQMDPWISSTWRKKWSSQHTPNMITKDKLRRFRQERTHRQISLLEDKICLKTSIGPPGPKEDRDPKHLD